MSLKNIQIANPTYSDIIPSTKQRISMSPFKVGDEKVLLMASESKDAGAMANALKDVIRNCVDDVEPEKLAHYDLEYLFIKLRSISVGEVASIAIKCDNCDTQNKIDVDLTSIEVRERKDHNNLIKVNDNLAFKMKSPDLVDIAKTEQTVDSLIKLIASSVETVFYGEETITVGPSDIDDLLGIINQLNTKQFQLFQDFFATAPKLSKDIEFKCGECGHQNNKVLEGLASFF